MFKKVLIANRGEIACRIIKTLKKMEIISVAVYSEADATSQFVDMADEAYPIGPSPASESYLNIDKIIQVAKDNNVDAVHPGYGFLAENPLFVQRLEAENITFIGPEATAIKTLGDKIEAKKIAKKVGAPILSGDLEPASTQQEAEKQATKLGFPVLIKAVAGGGGKGMRRVNELSELKEAVTRAMGEAQTSFGDSRIFIEKYLEKPRHIEIQILGDKHGTVLTLGERECSVQRRYQKLLEEAPSPFVDEKTRQELCQTAINLAKEVGYYSLGTVEFLLDKDKNFYFLEINPRIQVEHPVTEEITGIDVVEQMIKVTAGEKLSLNQADVTLKGWSMEARICAEDPSKGFVPSIGRLTHVKMPDNENIRIDTGIVEGSEISPYYDSMIAKVISYGDTREEARLALIEQLNQTCLKGLNHNVIFLTAMAAHPEFASGDFSTDFIEKNYGDAFEVRAATDKTHDLMMRFVAFKTAEKSATSEIFLRGSDDLTAHVEMTAPHQADISLGDEGSVAITLTDDKRYGIATISNGADQLTLNYRRDTYDWILTADGTQTKISGVPAHISDLLTHIPEKTADDFSHYVLSPMPGLLLSLDVKEGDTVASGTALAVVEAMKMENVIRAHRSGKIIKLHVKPGESLAAEQPIIEFETQEAG